MKMWEKQALELLHTSLNPFPQELNEIDWKLDLSPDTTRLAQHLSAFSNYDGGGVLTFGINNKGTPVGISDSQCGNILSKLGNIARQNLDPPIVLDHVVTIYQGVNLLFVRIGEARDKPVHLRSSIYDSYIRSVGETRKMTKQEVASCIAKAQGTRFEDGIAMNSLSAEETLKALDFTAYFDLVERRMPNGSEPILDVLIEEGMVRKNGDLFDITNLGAVLFAKDIEQFEGLKRKTVRAIVYGGKDRLKTIKEVDGKRGYAAGFEALINFINGLLPSNEIIGTALRQDIKMYPEIAIRELAANALIFTKISIS